VYAVEFEGKESLIKGLPANEAAFVEDVPYRRPAPGGEALVERPLVVGAGPAGLFCALLLAEGGYRPLVVERGQPVEKRGADVAALVGGEGINPESNLLFGEGGAGAYSDGKLTTRIHDASVRHVLEVLSECGAPESILVDARPHIGSDLLPGVIKTLHRRITDLGGEFRFGFKVERLLVDSGGAARGVESGEEHVAAGVVVLAPGSSARGLFETLVGQRVALEAKPFQVGLRIEHPQDVIDRAIYCRARGALPPAEYIISTRASAGTRAVASFCMCPGGAIVPAISKEGHLSTNGASASGRAGRFANAALIVTVGPDDIGSCGPLAGVSFQRGLEQAAFEVAGDYRAPAQRAADFLRRRKSASLPECSYPLGIVSADLTKIVPDFVSKAIRAALSVFDRKLPGFVKDGLLVGVEARVSCPVRITRDKETRQSVSTGKVYPAGEGSGYAGGITSSAVDGMKTAESIISRFAQPG
ncbi:MAG: FAD-binding protein, partial [Planctomycetes bacterium]|nr:FAD-binding protein [Planctomycetota bacterium]